MRKIFSLSVLMIIALAIGACRPAETQALPTLASTLPPVSAATATVTESIAATTVPTIIPTREDLPPTWTPTDIPSPTPDPSTPTPVPTVFFPQQQAACETFQVDRANSTTSFPITAQPTVAWTAVAGAGQYRLQVYGFDQGGNYVQIYENYLAETRFALPADLFALGSQYGWDVYPIGADGNQMCIAIGNELLPVRQ